MILIFIFIPGNVSQKFSALRQTQKTVDIVCSYLVIKVLKRIQTMSSRPLFHKVDTKRGKFSIKLLGIPLYMLQNHNKRNEDRGRD